MRKRSDRKGKSIIATNGMRMTIITYRNATDIDVKFEDGTIIQHKSFASFKSGHIRNPNAHRGQTNRVGETITATNGMKMTIIAYRTNYDIDVQFKDGTILRGKSYQAFKNGQIRNINSHIGTTNTANNGMKMTIVAYRSYEDIDVQFEDGTIATHKTYQAFKKGLIRKPVNHIGETMTANNGMKMTIIAYYKYNLIDIKFEDGTIVKNRSYNMFKKGNIRNPNINMYRKDKSHEKEI